MLTLRLLALLLVVVGPLIRVGLMLLTLLAPLVCTAIALLLLLRILLVLVLTGRQALTPTGHNRCNQF